MSRRLFIDIETLPPQEGMRAALNPALVAKLDGGRRALQLEAVAECSEEQSGDWPCTPSTVGCCVSG